MFETSESFIGQLLVIHLCLTKRACLLALYRAVAPLLTEGYYNIQPFTGQSLVVQLFLTERSLLLALYRAHCSGGIRVTAPSRAVAPPPVSIFEG